MLTKTIAEQVLHEALKTGGDFAEIFCEDRNSGAMGLVDGHVEAATTLRRHGAGIRIYRGLNSVYVHTNDTSLSGLTAAARKAADAVPGEGGARDIRLTRTIQRNLHLIRELPMDVDGARKVEGHDGAQRAVVVLTRDRDYVKSLGNEGLVLRSHRYDAYPYFTHALETRYLRYNAQRDLLFAMEREQDPRVLVIAPEDPVTVDVTGADGGALLSLYVKGRQQAEARLEEIAAFIGHNA